MSGRSKIAVIVVLLIVCSISLILFTKSTQKPAESTPPATVELENSDESPESGETAQIDPDSTPQPAPLPENIEEPESDTASAPATSPAAEDGTAVIDVSAALKERRVGNPDAPVTIQEYASLTCSHCGHFHKTMFNDLKAQSIDTGKASLVFNDFPLNKPALDASMIARCLPEARYFSFISLLFENQDDWAYDPDYIKYLKQNAQLAGLSAAQFDACLSSSELRNGILTHMKSEQEKHEINSTPTFVIGETVIRGALPLISFTKAVDDEVAAKTAPETQAEPEDEAEPEAESQANPDTATE